MPKISLRDRIEPEGEIDMDALKQAWIDYQLTPEDELKTILEHVYYSHADPKYREACEFIKRTADLLRDKDMSGDHA